jgi:high-affinity nickel permease
MATRVYSKAATFPDGIDPGLLQHEIAAVIATITSITTAGDVVTIEFSAEPDDALLAAVIAAHGLALAKSDKTVAIDDKTRELIQQGFTFAGLVFSLSTSSQSTLLGLDALRNDPLLVYPINYNTLDDLDVYAIPDAATMHAFFLTAVGTVRAWLDSGTALKNLVRAAATVAAVNAIVDPR